MELQKCLALKMLKIMKYKLSNHSTLSLKKAIISILRNKQFFRIFFTGTLFMREHLLKYSKMTRLFFRKLY